MVASVTTASLPDARRAPSRTEVRQRQTRIRLREVAHQLIAAQGVAATTIQEITDAADIGFGTFYNYYPTKEALAGDVLDCMIHNLALRNDLVTVALGETDPVRIVANSVRFVMRATVADPLFHWWFEHIELLVDRMRVGFGPFGMRDIQNAVDHGDYRIISGNHDLAWSQLVWLMAVGASDIIRGVHRFEDERAMVEGVLRVMGVDHDHAHVACDTDLPEVPDLPIDFAFDLPD